MGLFKPAWQWKEWSGRASDYIRKQTDPTKLAEIARSAPNHLVRQRARERLRSLCHHEWGATNCKICGRERNIKEITDQSVLKSLVSENYAKRNASSRELEALKYITDQLFLATIAKKHSDSSMRSKAVEAIDDQNILADIALNSDIVSGYGYTGLKMTVQTDIVLSALSRITDESLLASIAKESSRRKDWSVCLSALENITDIVVRENTMQSIVLDKQADWFKRESVIKMITDRSFLESVSKNESHIFPKGFSKHHISGLQEKATKRLQEL
jgi:hypothetical protein